MEILFPPEREFTVQEIADKIRVSPKTVYGWINTGKLLATRYGGAIRIGMAAWYEFLHQSDARK